MDIITAQFSDWKSALEDFQKSVEKTLKRSANKKMKSSK